MGQGEGNVVPYNWSGTLGPVYDISFTEVVPLVIDTCHKKFMNQDLKGRLCTEKVIGASWLMRGKNP